MLYRAALPSGRRYSLLGRLRVRFFQSVRNVVLKFHDPLCTLRIHGVELKVPLSHPLPIYHRLHPLCDTVLGRVSQWIRRRDQRIVLLDVGANIGDTVIASKPEAGDKVFAVEPSASYARILRENLRLLECPHEVIEKACTGDPGQESCKIEARNGTGAISTSGSGDCETTTIDELAEEFPELRSCNLLKIDIDGFDYEALRGANELISEQRPCILMESDVFENASYFSDFQELVRRLSRSGYKDVIAYDNYGWIIYVSGLEDIRSIFPLLYYQTTRGSIYLDLLFGVDLAGFLDEECEFFSSLASNAARREVSRSIAIGQGFRSETN